MKEILQRDQDGIYRWNYIVDLKRNKAVFKTTAIATALSFLFPLLILTMVFIFIGEFPSFIREVLPIFLIVGLVVIVIVIASYLYIIWYYEGYFHYQYEMDNEGITVMRQGKDAEKTKELGKTAFIVGMTTKNYGLAGAGMNAAIESKDRSEFKKIKSIKGYPESDMITLRSFMLYNQIFVEKKYYDFVLEFIKEHTNI